ncbi:hypothetical protein L596_015061 [Steinernema carpocapsae]|uniref:Peptidase metallopeptidase domain-containing protein n=1 Tax=Steinernema carpocapsae TaxID=34508 RepID=A0A4U5NEQ3_STECR|nr:hypothetical protein L596_015061 [Steinernema carpocapsae]
MRICILPALRILAISALLFFCSAQARHAQHHRPSKVVDAVHYLKKFGYMEADKDAESLETALRQFQEFSHLHVTGRVDKATIRKMHQKRCGNGDLAPVMRVRTKRYALEGSYWSVKNLTYRITKKSSALPDFLVRRVLKRAFDVWEASSPLRFTYKPRGQVHIEVVFARGRHGDGEPFDGKGQILAHAFFPRFGGDVHFDDDEYWSPSKSDLGGVDLFAVATHEIGHSLGLKHSQNEHAIMAPFYQTYTGDALHLNNDDIKALMVLYGSSPIPPKASPRPLGPNICMDASLDAITVLGNGTTYAFKGDFYWRMNPLGSKSTPIPHRIIDDWPGLEGFIDAVVTDNDGDSYVFKGDRYWLFDRTGRVYTGYPKKISIGLTDTPSDIDAAFVWPHDDKPYFFKNDQFWKYSRYGMTRGWPRKVTSLFRGLFSPDRAPRRIDAALRASDGSSFLFVGDKYYRLQNWRHFKVSPGYPRNTAVDWFGCPSRV